MRKKITIIGGGSSTFVPQLLRLFLQSRPLQGSTITLMDVDARRLAVMDSLARTLVEREAADLVITSTSSQREALAGADFVIVAISAGGMAAWELDIEIPARYGIFMHVADSIGPGGIMRALRHVPVLASICEDLDAVAPHAWVFNYSNPASANALAMQTVPSINSISLCSCSVLPRHAQLLAAWAGVAPDEVAVPALVGGINHCSAIVQLRLKDGRDALPLIRARSAQDLVEWVRGVYGVTDQAIIDRMVRGTGISQPVTYWIYDTYGILPYCWTHWLEFHPNLQRLAEPYQGRAQGLKVQYGCTIHDMDYERARGQHWEDLAERWSKPEHSSEVSLANLPPGDEDEGIEVVSIIEAMVEHRNVVHTVNITNNGAIDNLPADAVVEVSASVGSYGIRPLHTGPLPEPIAAHLRLHQAVQRLTVQAGLTGDRRIARQAFLLDPVISAHLEPPESEKLLEELLAAHARYLPRFA